MRGESRAQGSYFRLDPISGTSKNIQSISCGVLQGTLNTSKPPGWPHPFVDQMFKTNVLESMVGFSELQLESRKSIHVECSVPTQPTKNRPKSDAKNRPDRGPPLVARQRHQRRERHPGGHRADHQQALGAKKKRMRAVCVCVCVCVLTRSSSREVRTG